jgi:hypothetical protein
MTSLQEALGYDADARLLIPHVDDVGMCWSANRAFLDLCGNGVVTSGSVMVPCPWFRGIAEAAVAEPALDLGIHLTLTSEWRHYRWRPISTTSESSGLLDADGYMWPTVAELRAHLDPEAARDEMTAQIEAALSADMEPTHLDTHMGAALLPALMPIYVELGRRYRLPILFPRRLEEYLWILRVGELGTTAYEAALAALDRTGAPIIDGFRMTPGVPSAESDAAYRGLVADIAPGVTFLSLHCSAPGDVELILPGDIWSWRTDEHRIFAEPPYRAWLDGEGIRTIGFRPLRDLWRRRLSA